MKKGALAALLLLVIIAFFGLDFLLNGKTAKNEKTVAPVTNIATTDRQLIQEGAPTQLTITRRSRTTELFERIDLSDLPIKAYRNEIKKNEYPQDPPFIAYEIQGEQGQGGINYLNIKLKFVNGLKAEENIKEVEGYGDASFFFNNPDNQESAFLVTQLGNHVYGFQYDKKNQKDFDIIRTLISSLPRF